MPYVERVTRAGKTIEVERYFTSRYKKPGIKRGDKVKPTKEEQKKVNTRAAERKLRLLLNANFGYGDYHLELDYIRKKGQPDRSREQMRKDMDIFLRELRKECKKAGITLCWDNLEALCQDCHNKEHHAKNVRAKRYAFTADGELIPPIQKNIFRSR